MSLGIYNITLYPDQSNSYDKEDSYLTLRKKKKKKNGKAQQFTLALLFNFFLGGGDFLIDPLKFAPAFQTGRILVLELYIEAWP